MKKLFSIISDRFTVSQIHGIDLRPVFNDGGTGTASMKLDLEMVQVKFLPKNWDCAYAFEFGG